MQKVNELLVHQRPLEQADHGLIYNSLLKSYQQQGYGVEGINKGIFFAHHKKQIEKLLEHCLGICAVNPGDHDQIYAYILFSKPVMTPILHYVYVKAPFRNMGFATWLIESMHSSNGGYDSESCQTQITHRTHPFQKFIEPKGKYLFNPYLLGELHGSDQAKECEAG